MPEDSEALEAQIEKLAQKLLREKNPAAENMEAARKAARRMIEDSEERTFDPAVTDPEADGVIRRTSSQTASGGGGSGMKSSPD